MSTYWDVYCVDCKSQLGLERTNHAEEAMKTIAAKAREIVELGAWCASLDLELVRLGDTLSFEWFGEHVHHRLVARNEYGENSGDCNRRSEGPHSRDLLCRLPAGHEGDHVLSKRWEE